MAFGGVFRDKSVLVTGHTGFKGAWLSEWLISLGANVTGLALPPATSPSLFDQLELGRRLEHRPADIREAEQVRSIVREAAPDFVFHLAAQSLVRKSYDAPVETYAVNLMGTIHLMEALREARHPSVAVIVTTDKCYENREQVRGYTEDDILGGADPYSSSKAACEIAVAAWRRSFFDEHPVKLASARAGNVIGGGDWAADRIVPDCIRSLERGERIRVRNRTSARPWQHVLEPLSGYLQLAASIHATSCTSDLARLGELCSAFNFGPGDKSTRTVADVVDAVLRHWPGDWIDASEPGAPHEAKLLALSTEKARKYLRWHAVWDFDQAVGRTVRWYRDAADHGNHQELASRDIADYTSDAAAKGARWTA